MIRHRFSLNRKVGEVLDVDSLLESVDIVEYIEQFVDLEERNGEYWGLSPFKEEKTPSFSVSPVPQRFYDFSSGAYGNVLDFIKKYNNVDFYEAYKILSDWAGFSDSEKSKHGGKLHATKILRRYKPPKQEQKEGRDRILPDDYMSRFVKDESKLKVWEDEGIDRAALNYFDVRYDPFSNRLVFPLTDTGGHIINVCGRTLDPDYKEKGLRKYTYFKPLGTLDTMFAWSNNSCRMAAQKEIILFEGAKSVMLAQTWGIGNTAAILTSHLNPHQLKILIKFCSYHDRTRVVFALDKDVDIKEDVNIQKLKRFCRVEYIKDALGLLEPKMAPVDKGYETWCRLYEGRRGLA